jgi:hypothetical protein
MDKETRDCTRVMVDDIESAELLYRRLKPLVALCYGGAIFSGVNERFRFLKYGPSIALLSELYRTILCTTLRRQLRLL